MANEEIAYAFAGDPTDRYAIDAIIKGWIGNMCYVSAVPEHEDDFIEIGVYTDEIITDSVREEPQVRFLKHDNVFRAYYRNGDFGRNIVFPSLSEIDRQISSFMVRSRESSERSLLMSAGSRIINIPSVRNQMNPIFEMVNSVLRSKTSGVERSAFKGWSDAKLNRYTGFLGALDIISAEGTKITEGKAMRSIDRSMGVMDIYDELLSQMVSSSAKYMIAKLHMTHLDPYLRISNANCMTSFIEDFPLEWNWKKYEFYLKRIYGVNTSRIKIESNVTMLSSPSVRVLTEKPHSDETVYSCNDEVFAKYKEIAKGY